jgi:hypothetical protein
MYYNKSFPVTIIDDFYPNPHEVRNYALSQKFEPNKTGRWPGARTNTIHQIDEQGSIMMKFMIKKILSLFYTANDIKTITIDSHFQHIKPFHKDKNHVYNRGYIHNDSTIFGGVIYLDPNSEEGTGTSIYSLKNKLKTDDYLDEYANNLKFKYHNHNIEFTDNDIDLWNQQRDKFQESVRIENIFNRCILFDGYEHHGVPSFGTKERLTQVFFVYDLEFSDCNIRFPLRREFVDDFKIKSLHN